MATLVHQREGMPPIILVSILWNLVIGVGSVYAALQIFQIDDFYNLGSIPRTFVGLVALMPALLAALSSVQLYNKRGSGRYLSLMLNYVGMVMAFAYLLHLWGFFNLFEGLSTGILKNAQWLWGIAIGYALFWTAGRFDEDGQASLWLERLGVGLAMIALVALLWSSHILDAITHVIGKYDELTVWAVSVGAIIFGSIAYQMLQLGDYFGETTDQRIAWQGWLMLSPNIIGFMVFFAGPLLLSFYLSFTDSSVGQIPNFKFLKNYGEILSLEFKTTDDPQVNPQKLMSFGYTPLETVTFGDMRLIIGAKDTLFWQSLRNTIVFCLLLVPLSTIPALLLALILNAQIPGVKVFRAVYFLPSVAAVVGTALIWRWLYDPTIGFFNYAITQGVDFLNRDLGTSISDPQIKWLTGKGTILLSIVLLAAWQVVGFNTVLFLAGLQGIPRILYEAAYVDGANRVQQFFKVTLPMLAPTTFFVVVTTVITGLQVFNEPYALISSRPLPIEATTSVYYLYNRGFFRFEFGYASAVAWLLFFLIFSVTLLQFRLQRSQAYDSN